MSSFLFPKKSCTEIDSLISDFWWGQNEHEGRRFHWRSWNVMSKAKSEGGTRFRSFQAFNKALLAKTAWRLIQNLNDLWCKVLKGIYLPNSSFMEAKKGGKASWGWISILEWRELLKELYWKVGRNSNVRVWGDRWISSLSHGSLNSSPTCEDDKMLKVGTLFVNGHWNLSAIANKISAEEKEQIMKMAIPNEMMRDEAVWLK